jgi:hypothetical protein
MDRDAQVAIADLQFVIARILWAPYCDRERAMLLAELAARRHPDPVKRVAIAEWMALRKTPPLDELVVAVLREELAAQSRDTNGA